MPCQSDSDRGVIIVCWNHHKSIWAVKSYSHVTHASVLLIRLPRALDAHFARWHHREQTWHDCLSRLWQDIYQALQHGTSQKCDAFEWWWWGTSWYRGIHRRESFQRKTVYTKFGYYINTRIEIRNLWKIPFQDYSSDEQSSADDETSGVESDDEETTIWDDLTLEAWMPDTEKTFYDKRAEFVGQSVPSHAAHQAAYRYVVPSLRRNIRKLYMAKIELNKTLRRDGVHK